jgi:hypothetical protein
LRHQAVVSDLELAKVVSDRDLIDPFLTSVWLETRLAPKIFQCPFSVLNLLQGEPASDLAV